MLAPMGVRRHTDRFITARLKHAQTSKQNDAHPENAMELLSSLSTQTLGLLVVVLVLAAVAFAAWLGYRRGQSRGFK